MRGGSQAHLIEADDDHFYIVKLRNNPQHLRVLINELITAEILAYLRITSPVCRVVHFSTDFILANPDIYIETGPQRLPPEPGPHFGSCHVGGNADNVAVYDFIPDRVFDRITNLSHFRAALVFDRWVGNSDGRQCVFVGARPQHRFLLNGSANKPGFVAVMIDQGFAFNGPEWEFLSSAVLGLYSRSTVYNDVKALSDFEPWLTAVQEFPQDVLGAALRKVPAEWVNGDREELERLLERLYSRRKRLDEVLRECCGARGNPFPKWSFSS